MSPSYTFTTNPELIGGTNGIASFEVITLSNPLPNSYPLEFDELESLKELFEFLLQFITMLCKFFYGDENGNVDLTKFTKN